MGLPPASEQKAMIAETLYKEGELSIKDIAENLKISKTTLYGYLRHRGVQIGKKTNR